MAGPGTTYSTPFPQKFTFSSQNWPLLWIWIGSLVPQLPWIHHWCVLSWCSMLMKHPDSYTCYFLFLQKPILICRMLPVKINQKSGKDAIIVSHGCTCKIGARPLFRTHTRIHRNRHKFEQMMQPMLYLHSDYVTEGMPLCNSVTHISHVTSSHRFCCGSQPPALASVTNRCSRH